MEQRQDRKFVYINICEIYIYNHVMYMNDNSKYKNAE